MHAIYKKQNQNTRHSEYANKTLPDKTTVYETAVAWEAFTYDWLKARAVGGFFDELGSSGYWTRTWPCIFAYNTLSEPGSRVYVRCDASLWKTCEH